MRSEEKLNKIVEALEALETLARLEKELKDERKECEKEEKEEVDVSKIFSRECSMHVTVKGDEENRGSETCVEFNGCKSLADQTILAVSVLSSIVENMDKRETVDYLAHVCAMVAAGERAGIYKSKPPVEDKEEE